MTEDVKQVTFVLDQLEKKESAAENQQMEDKSDDERENIAN